MSKAKKKGDKKGKTMALTDFLAAQDAPKLVTVKPNNWSDIVDQELEIKPTVFNVSNLPTAPRSAVDVDYSEVSKNPPFVAHVANLSFEIGDENLRAVFADLNPKSARVIKEGGRSRGLGFVEFETRESLIEALKRSDREVFGRKIRVVVSDKTDSHHTDSGSRGFSNRSGPTRGGGEDRADTVDNWRRAEPRFEERSDGRRVGAFEDRSENRRGGPFEDRSENRRGGPFEDRSDNRRSGGFDRDRPNRGNPSDGQRGNDYGFGYPRTRDDRGAGGNRDYDRQGPRNYHDDDSRSNSGMDRPRYSGRYSDNRDIRDRNTANDGSRDDQHNPPKERPRLQLQPRTKPLEENDALSASSSSVNNVAANVTHGSSISEANGSDDSSSVQRPRGSFSTAENQNENPDDHQEKHGDLNDDSSRLDTSETSTPGEQSAAKPTPSRGAGASIFGGAKPVDTLTRELEIERKMKELQTSVGSPGENDETGSTSSKPSYTRGSGERDRRDEGRYNRGGEYHHKREYSGGRQYEDDGRRRSDDDHQRRGGNDRDRDRYGGPPRRDNDSGRTSKYNYHHNSDRDHERGNQRESNRSYPPRDRDDREGFSWQQRGNHDSNEQQNNARPSASSSNNNSNADSLFKNQQQRGVGGRRIAPAQEESIRVPLSNKFGMLDDDDDLVNDNEEVQTPTTED